MRRNKIPLLLEGVAGGYGEEEINRLKSTIREYTEGLGEFQDDNHNNEIIIIDSKNATKAIKETKDYVESILSAP